MNNPTAGESSAKTSSFLRALGDQVQRAFDDEKVLLSFAEYLDVVRVNPAGQARDAVTYLRDAILYYGVTTVQRAYGPRRRFNLFDCPFDEGRSPLVGHEDVQNQVFGLISGFVQEGRVDRLVLLHGPNGSAKSSFISCLMRGLEDYSTQPEGVLYTFNWIFPSSKLDHANIGFGGRRSLDALSSFAHLAEGDVDARILNETRDHPLLLLPRADRLRFLRPLVDESHPLPDSLTEGELSPKARQIFDALLKAYKGDLSEVFKHVQVERFYVSRRYRQAAVTVDPQMRVDASVRQVTADRSLSSLPPSLQNITLFEPVGDLVDANRGLIEFNDLLKRPLEAFKYLLSTCETGAVRLETVSLYLDMVLMGSCNAAHLSAFKEIPDFASFKGRIELVTMPYLVDFETERRIYTEHTQSAAIDRPVAPHTDTVASLWAVLTRLVRADPEEFPTAVRKAMGQLTPLQKARLYAHGEVPDDMPRDLGNAIAGLIPELYRERASLDEYEGRRGASPRVIKAVLLGAARRPKHRCLTPFAVFEELEALCEQTSTYAFLRLKPAGDYHHPHSAIHAVKVWYLETVEDELHHAMGLVDDAATHELFERYIEHVTHDIRREKLLNTVTGAYEEANQHFMREVEGRFAVESEGSADFRAGVMHRIAAWRMDHPDATFDLTAIFSDRLAQLNDAFYREKRDVADKIKQDVLSLIVDAAETLTEPERVRAEDALTGLERFGYTRETAVEVIGQLLKLRQETDTARTPRKKTK